MESRRESTRQSEGGQEARTREPEDRQGWGRALGMAKAVMGVKGKRLHCCSLETRTEHGVSNTTASSKLSMGEGTVTIKHLLR